MIYFLFDSNQLYKNNENIVLLIVFLDIRNGRPISERKRNPILSALLLPYL